MPTATYDIHKSYDDNYSDGPVFSQNLPDTTPHHPVKLWGYTINSPIGVPAGPLLNAEYINLYASAGFDLPVYKTVRTQPREAHPHPNCLFVDRQTQLQPKDVGQPIYAKEDQVTIPETIAITNSFGMPSKSVEIWQEDIQKAQNSLSHNQLMFVSCVGTPDQDRSIEADYAHCARLAVEAGAKAVELNLSCPNVTSKEGSIFQDAELSSKITKAVKQAIGTAMPLMIKMGYINDLKSLTEIITANAPYIDGISAINTVSMQVLNQHHQQALPGKGRLNSGICGHIIRQMGVNMVKNLYQVRTENHFDFVICGVGGITHASDFNTYFQAGADIAMSATGAMWDTFLAVKWRQLQQTSQKGHQ